MLNLNLMAPIITLNTKACVAIKQEIEDCSKNKDPTIHHLQKHIKFSHRSWMLVNFQTDNPGKTGLDKMSSSSIKKDIKPQT